MHGKTCAFDVIVFATDRGKQLAEQIKVVGDLMVIEIGDLNLLAKKLTERKVEEIVDRWRIKDAENQ